MVRDPESLYDFKFSEQARQSFEQMGLTQLSANLQTQGFGSIKRSLAIKVVYEKYLTDADVIKGGHIQRYANELRDSRLDDAGREFLEKLLDARSEGTWRWEMMKLEQNLPSREDYIQLRHNSELWADHETHHSTWPARFDDRAKESVQLSLRQRSDGLSNMLAQGMGALKGALERRAAASTVQYSATPKGPTFS